MTTRDDNPKVFISYSWSSPQHEEFVLNLAERLMSDGVHIILDKWDLKAGNDKYEFMEQMVKDPEILKVLVISDKAYASKADKRTGGVGTETIIISEEVYSEVKQEKFIPVVTEFEDGKACLPTFLKSRIYYDLSNEEKFYDEYEKILRDIFNQPKITKPVIGKAPSYLFDDNPRSLVTISVFSNLKDAIQKEKKSYKKLGKDFLEQLLNYLESTRITEVEHDIDDRIIEKIHEFKPYRDQFVEYIQLLCDFEYWTNCKADIFEFFEDLIALNEAPKSMMSYNKRSFGNYQFISSELFLYLITILIKNKQYDAVDFFLTEKYYIRNVHEERSTDFCDFNIHIEVLDSYRKQRLNNNKISITADIMHDNADVKGIPFEKIMQTDFILSIRSVLYSKNKYYYWYPRTLVYKSSYGELAFELFSRAESQRHFEDVKKLFNVKSKDDLVSKLNNAEQVVGFMKWKFDYRTIPFLKYLNLEKLYDQKNYS